MTIHLKDQVYCFLDYETYSEAPLRKVGAYEYSVHPSTEIICLAYRVGTLASLRDAKTRTWAPAVSDASTIIELLNIFENPRTLIVAQNALFEQLITRHVLSKLLGSQARCLKGIPPARWVCTAALAATLALPRNLEGAGMALKLGTQKDMVGHKLMLKWCKPRKPSKADPSTRHSDPTELLRIVSYCARDIDTTVELFLKMPPLTPTERKVWCLDQAVNLRGFQVDRPLVTAVLKMIAEESVKLNHEASRLTDGCIASANQRDAVLAWLETQGVFLPDLQKKTVEDALKEGLAEGPAKRMLEIRLAISKTSTAKYQAFEQRSRHNSRLRDILVYHAASTGRWGGAGIQPQNFPKGNIKDIVTACEVLRDGDLEMVRLIYGDPMNVFSSCLRGMIVAPKGKVLDVADYAAIELRVAFWVAGHTRGLAAFREGRDLYKELASKIFDVATDSVTSAQRFVGKTAELGCIFGMGKPKFRDTCRAQGQEISEEVASLAVDTFRRENAPVVKLWDLFGRVAIAAIENPRKKFTVNKTSWYAANGFLWCQLPSGRKLAYASPSVRYELTSWGEKRPVICFWGVDSKTKKWSEQRAWGGVLTENVVQATARDLMAEAMLRIEATGIWEIVLSVHDELIGERLENTVSVDEFCRLMSELPDWADGLPVKAEGWSGTRYKKG